MCLRLSTFVLLLVCALSGAAQGGPALVPSGSGAVLVNPTKRPILFLLHTPKGAGVAKTQMVQVGPKSSAPVDMPAGSIIAQEMVLDPAVPFGKPPRPCSTGAPGLRLTAAQVSEQLSTVERALDQQRASAESFASKVADVEIADYFDEAQVRINDPVQAEMRSEAIRDSGGNSALQTQIDGDKAVMELVGATINVALANGEVIAAHSAAAGDEAAELQKMIVTKKEFLVNMQGAAAKQSVLNKGDREFNSFAATELSKQIGPSPAVSVPSNVEFSRLCPGPAPDIDDLGIRMPGPDGVNVMLGRAHFDKGGDEDLVFRRVVGTPQWLASVYWPLESSRATVSLRSGKGWAKVGEVKTDRPSVQDELAQANKSVALLAKKHRAAAYAAEGGDERRTVVMP